MSNARNRNKARRPRASAKAGLSPGTPVFIGEQKLDTATVEVIEYDDTHLERLRGVPLAACIEQAKSTAVTWINVNGVHDVSLIEALGKGLDLHPLTREDIVNTAQRPKAEEFPGYLYVVLKMLSLDDATGQVRSEHVSLVLGEHFVISFQEQEGDVFDAVRGRIQSARGRIRTMKADYLAYALMDAVVDHYFTVIERIGDRIDELEAQVLADAGPDVMHEVHRLKRDMLTLRRAVWPLREEVAMLEKSDSPLIRTGTRVFLRDLYDHAIQVIDMVETFRDLLGGLHDTYLSRVSNRMNEIMKVLTIIATTFIPLTFVAGIYGMNFEHMPELKWPWGYGLAWGVMIMVAGGMLVYFRRKKWL